MACTNKKEIMYETRAKFPDFTLVTKTKRKRKIFFLISLLFL